jgi:hypothetical protein
MATPKRRRISLGGVASLTVLKTPKHVLDSFQGSRRFQAADRSKILHAISSCIVTAANSPEVSEDAYDLLEELLELQIDPNETDTNILDKIGGPPLFLAAKLNVPKAVKILCEYGASLTQVWESRNPIQVIILTPLLKHFI